MRHIRVAAMLDHVSSIIPSLLTNYLCLPSLTCSLGSHAMTSSVWAQGLLPCRACSTVLDYAHHKSLRAAPDPPISLAAHLPLEEDHPGCPAEPGGAGAWS